MNTLDKKLLEDKFGEDFSSPFFPILADIYLKEGDIRRAKLVCEVGLEHDPSNTDGKFISAQIALSEKNLKRSEKLLKQVVLENPAHFNALRTLINIEVELNRSPKTIEKYINKLEQFMPNDLDCRGWRKQLNIISKNFPVDTVPGKKNTSLPQDSTGTKTTINEDAKCNIDTSMATFAMVDVLKNQKEFSQALSILDILESSGKDNQRVKSLKKEIMQYVTDLK